MDSRPKPLETALPDRDHVNAPGSRRTGVTAYRACSVPVLRRTRSSQAGIGRLTVPRQIRLPLFVFIQHNEHPTGRYS